MKTILEVRDFLLEHAEWCGSGGATVKTAKTRRCEAGVGRVHEIEQHRV